MLPACQSDLYLKAAPKLSSVHSLWYPSTACGAVPMPHAARARVARALRRCSSLYPRFIPTDTRLRLRAFHLSCLSPTRYGTGSCSAAIVIICPRLGLRSGLRTLQASSSLASPSPHFLHSTVSNRRAIYISYCSPNNPVFWCISAAGSWCPCSRSRWRQALLVGRPVIHPP